MAKTFDVSQPGQYEDYLRESAAQMFLHGNLYVQLSTGASGTALTILDGAGMPETRQPDFMLEMDDGRVLPMPAPGGGL